MKKQLKKLKWNFQRIYQLLRNIQLKFGFYLQKVCAEKKGNYSSNSRIFLNEQKR